MGQINIKSGYHQSFADVNSKVGSTSVRTFKLLLRLIRTKPGRDNLQSEQQADQPHVPSGRDSSLGSSLDAHPISTNLQDNKRDIVDILGTSPDISLRSFVVTLADGQTLDALCLAINGISDTQATSLEVLEPLLREPIDVPGERLQEITKKIYNQMIVLETDLHRAITKTLNGQMLLLFDGYSRGIAISAEEYRLRSPEEPPSETLVKGPREGFIESTGANMALIRRRLRTPNLRFEPIPVGEISDTSVTLCYIEGIVKQELLERVRKRLQQVNIDDFQSAGQIEQYIEDNPYTLFPTIGNTERPDRIAMELGEGRIAVLVEGTPVTLYIPYLFVDAFKNVEDYNSRPYYTSLVRMLRFIAFFVSILAPALFVGALNFHKSMIPSEFITSIESAREKVPFPLVMEVALMTILFEIVREAGIRMPRQVGQALSIVGALILGQVSVQAGLISAPTIIAVSLSAIATFMITPITDVASVLRIALIVPTSLFGFFGLVMVLLGICTHVVCLTSIGEPYMAPFAPFHFADWRDTMIRVPLRWFRRRPASIAHERSTRIESLPPRRKPFT